MSRDSEAAARRMIREARAIGNEELAAGIERGLVDHRAWWDTDAYRERRSVWRSRSPGKAKDEG
jgi:hypothetical protein